MPFSSHPPDTCYNFSARYCDSPKYWYKGFLSLQSSIDAAIIEVVANHSVWEEMKSIAGVRMKSRSVIYSITLEYSYFMITIVMCFSSFMYFLSMNVVRERKKLKVLMKTMGLQDIAFWLSWSLLYAVYVLILSCLLTALVVQEAFYVSSFPAVLLLFFLYGLACIHMVFMLCSLLRTSKLAGSMGFLITFLFGCLSLAVLIENLPEPLKWFLGLFCPFAFNAGIVFHLEKYGIGFSFSNLMEESYFLFSTYIMLIFDSVLYMLLAMYFDKVLPGKKASKTSLFFFPKLGVAFILGLSLNIYEGQITALLGHSGAGKTTLLNVLSGLTLPSEGSATIYDYKLSEIGDREEIREMIGICPQFNVQFEVLTVKENLRTFAEIKGIKSREVEREVQTILELLDISNVQDTQAEKLSGGQKRKLSIGIAMLGSPQVLLLDEPTAGLDPLSRHQVWSLLKEQRAGRVILFSTQFMDEADILADRKAFISHGRLKCVGSSLFLKKKWGIGYHLRYLLHESCNVESVTSLVKQHIPNVIFSGHSQYELRYKLPLENVNKFPDLFRGLDSCSDWGIINYGVSMTTLEDVFLRLEEEATLGQEGTSVWAEAGQKCPEETEPGSLLLSGTGKATVSGAALWRQQVSAMAWVHFLKLKGSLELNAVTAGGMIFTLKPSKPLLLLSIMIPLLLAFTPGSGIEDFIHTLESQDLTVEITSQENITEELKHNGAIKVSREGQSYRFTILCHMEAVNCFPVLVNIISNALLRALNSTAHIRIWSHPFFSVNNPRFWDYFVSFYLIYMLLLFPGFPPHFAMGYLQDYKTGARAQLRVSGLFPSAYWCGQALVDLPLCWLLLFSMFGLQFAMSNKISGSIGNIFLLVMGALGYGVSIVLFIYLISFIFRKGWNCDFWSFILIVVSIWLDNVITDAPQYSRLIFLPPACFQKSVIIVSNLCKEYKTKKAGSVFKKKKKMATKNISFCVNKGEVLGLLGPNGAGKSTAIKMIAGEMTPTAGQVLLQKREGVTCCLQDHLGHCPQEDPLWPDLTVHQHLQVYAAVKGVRKEDTAAAVNRIVNALELQDYLKKSARKLSAGITRKLCFAMCMLGNPAVLLLDEPSTGMDPKGQRCVWKMIRAALKTKETGAILTTHYMEEAEAVCDRVAILVAGQLRCIGSIQYLKSKFGKGYLLEIKVKDPESTDLLHTEVLRIFPSAAQVIQTSCCPFQVFLELSREQEKDNFDLALDGAFEWKQLQQEDS
uniref:ATP binding cassette subfamily A member 10 n=1 Tax=Cairina moschata TaxID=8855 RepID=A0A8C3GIF0_CAIMO